MNCDYYPGGMLMVGRKYSQSVSYRYGFNGKEKDNDIEGEGNSIDYGARILDTRIGSRWMSADPHLKKYPNESPYLYAGGNPIYFLDPDGKDRIDHIKIITKDGSVLIKTQTTKNLFRSVVNEVYGGSFYLTKNDYEVFTTHDLRTGKDVETTSTNTLYGTGHATRIGLFKFLTIKFSGNDGDKLKLPQVVVFGSGTEDPGWASKADPNRGITVIDFGAFESMMGLIMSGMKVPELKGADPKENTRTCGEIQERTDIR